MKNFELNILNERFAKFGGPLFLEGNDVYANDTVAQHPIGAQAYADQGKIFRYSLVGGVTLVSGNLLQEAAQDTQFENMAVLASPIILAQNGAQTVNVTNGSTTVVPSAYVAGSLLVSVTPDLGSDYTILGITGTLTTGGALTVTVDHPLATAWTTSTKVTMKKSPWSGVIQAPASTQTGIAVGVANWAIPTATYGWVQTHGQASVLSDGSTFAVGSEVGTPSGTAGCATVYAAGTTHMKIGYARQAAATGKQISVFLTID